MEQTFHPPSSLRIASAQNIGLAGLSSFATAERRMEQSARRRVLVVDDARATLDLLAHTLTHLYNLSFATSGEAAIKLASNIAFDIILLDIVMPTIDGYETCRRLRELPHLQNVPIIFMSALNEIKSKTDGFNAGGVDYLTKPLEMAEVVTRIEVHLKLKGLLDTQKQLLSELSEERERTDYLLHNILPPSIAEQLKNGEQVPALMHEKTTIVFADLCGFTGIAHRHTPGEIINILNEIFSQFDLIAIRHGLYKIKTIGDCYMLVGGLPDPRQDHAQAVTDVALKMISTLARLDAVYNSNLQIRIGIHSGPVVAGVIGTHKFTYDIWGTTVNEASRMESSGQPSRIHISEVTAGLLAADFDLEHRGMVETKSLGLLSTYFVNGRRPC